MSLRERFNDRLNQIHDKISELENLVHQELLTALSAVEMFDMTITSEVFALDERVNHLQRQIETLCLQLIATQQPVATDLRRIVAMMQIASELERMGDHAKGIGKALLTIQQYDDFSPPHEITRMGKLISGMMQHAKTAYQKQSVELAREVGEEDEAIDLAFSEFFKKTMRKMATLNEEHEIVQQYEMLRIAQHLERFADRLTNIAEQVVFVITGEHVEMNEER